MYYTIGGSDTPDWDGINDESTQAERLSSARSCNFQVVWHEKRCSPPIGATTYAYEYVHSTNIEVILLCTPERLRWQVLTVPCS
jgi:hypothetical protein